MRLLFIFLIFSLTAFSVSSQSENRNDKKEVTESDTVGLSDFSFDALIMSMEEAETDKIYSTLGATLAYLDQLFQESIDPTHPQVIGGSSEVLRKDFDNIPLGDIPINVSEFTMPIRGRLSSRFGYRRRGTHHHNGIDIAITKSDTVKAAFPGKVVMTGHDKRGYGYYIVMSHPNGLHTLYAHLDKFLVVPGVTIEAGTPMAIGGKSGNSTGKHLHFEIRYKSVPVDPAHVINLRTGRPREATYIFNKEEILLARKLPSSDDNQEIGRNKKH